MTTEFKATALFDYTADEETELDLRAGEIVLVEEINESGWCLASKEGDDKSGWIPFDFIERISEGGAGAGAGAKADSTPPVENLSIDDAKAAVAAAAPPNNEKAVEYQTKAVEAFNSGKFEESAAAFKLAGENFGDLSNKATMYANRGAALNKLQRYDEACVAYEEALKAKPDHVQSLHNRGVSLRYLKRYEYALDAFSEAVKADPTYYTSWCGKCDVLKDLKRFEEAVEAASEAIKVDSNQTGGYLNRAVANVNMGRFETALSDFDIIASKGHVEESKILHIQTLHGFAHQQGGTDGLATLDKVAALEGTPGEETLKLRAVLLTNQEGKTDAAIKAFEALLKLNPNNVDGKVGLGNMLIIKQQYESALQNLEFAVKAGKPISLMTPSKIYYNIGVIHYELKDFPKAKAYFDQALKEDPANETAKKGLEVVAAAIAMGASGAAPGAGNSLSQSVGGSMQERNRGQTVAEAYAQKKQEEKKQEEEKDSSSVPIYPLTVLQKAKNDRPADIDPAKREQHLSKEEFFKLFKMTKPAFYKQPRWRQQVAKRKNELW